jgi:hypothetical protein
MSNSSGECGIGAVVPWANRLWMITYAPMRDTAAGREPWRTFRLPIAYSSFDGDHGWQTEWSRIRGVFTERSLLNAAGTFYVLPRVTSGSAAKIQPI